MGHNQNGIRELLTHHPVIPIATIDSLSQLDAIVDILLENHYNCIEITLRTEVSWEAIQKVKEKYTGAMAVGVGTVLSASQIVKARKLNVDFLVSPGITTTLIKGMAQSKIPFLPGVSNVSEIMLGMEMGCNTMKFFPTMLSGGLGALKTYNELFPNVQFCPTGGINASNYVQFLEMKNVTSVGGSWIIK